MSGIARILTIAGTTVREAVRSRILYALLFFAILLILSGFFLSSLSYVESHRILQDIGLGAARGVGVAIALFVGVGLIHREVERRTVYTILSKPITRAEFLLGKFAGLVCTVWLQVAIMGAAFAAVSLGAGAPLGAGHAAAFALLAVELAVVVALATFFSAFTTPVLSSFFAGGLWVVGNLSRNLRDLGAQAELESVRVATRWLFRLLPDVEGFDLSTQAVHLLPIAGSDLWLPLVYGAGYCTVVLVAAVALFERRDLR
jgi:ABC-type transport system involved in multi-copper enzyme maturation permease subunit